MTPTWGYSFGPYGHKMGHMASREKNERNAHGARYLRGLIGRRLPADRPTYHEIAEASGIPYESVKRLMTNKSEFTLNQFLSIASALDVSDEEALRALAEIVQK